MKKKNFRHILKPLLLLFFTLLIGPNAFSQIVSYPLTATMNSTSGQVGTMTTTGTNLFIDETSGAQTDGWETGSFKYWATSSFSTLGYQTINANASLNSDNTGPRDFALEYKLGASGTWKFVQNISITNSNTDYLIPLPIECNNQSNVYVRWIARSFINLNGEAVTAGSLNYIKAASITGLLPVAPLSGASGITLLSATQNTIAVDCTAGGAYNRIIVMNSINSFTNPSDNDIFIADATYHGDGINPHEQVIYNGTSTKVTVTVPRSTDQYYFRVFNYVYNGGMTRYWLPAATGNPKLCALEYITPDPATNIKLTSVTLGATITTPIRGAAISRRGIVWSLTPGVKETDNKKIEAGTIGGSFSLDYPGATPPTLSMARGITIYYKGYVTNESGTILSSESSFSNIPVFSGTGTWETASNWNVNEVPGTNGSTNGSILDNPIINGICTLGSSHECTNLAINSGKSLTISPATTLKVNGTLTNNADASGLLIQSSSSAANGSLIYANGSPSATVEMYSKASWNLSGGTNNQYHWQFFGIPVQSAAVNSTFGNCYVRQYNETSATDNNLWNDLTATSTLTSLTGYEIVQASPTKYTFRGQLTNSGISQNLPYTSGARFSGQHIFGNPFTAAINISGITFGANTEAAVYLYNTGTYTQWSNANGETIVGDGAGQYNVSPAQTGGSGGVPGQIPSMQGFLIKATSNSGSFTIPYSAVVSNTDRQRAPSTNDGATTDKVYIRMDVIGKTTKLTDKMWIFSEPTCTRKFDNGWDGYKMMGSVFAPQLFAIESDGDYQVNAVNNMNESYLGFQAGTDTEYTLKFTHENLDTQYAATYLVDLLENKTIDISINGTEYAFTATSTPTPSKRFKIVTRSNKTNNPDVDSQIKIFNTQGSLYVQNFGNQTGTFVLYNMAGSVVRNVKLDANVLTTIPLNLATGAYIAIAKTDSEKITERLIIR